MEELAMFRYFTFAIIFGLLIHLRMGNPLEMVMEDAFKGAVLFLGSILSLTCFLLAWKIWRTDPQIWKRNRQASLLCQNVRREKELTPTEAFQYQQFIKDGIITVAGVAVSTKTNSWVPQPTLSDYAVNGILHS